MKHKLNTCYINQNPVTQMLIKISSEFFSLLQKQIKTQIKMTNGLINKRYLKLVEVQNSIEIIFYIL